MIVQRRSPAFCPLGNQDPPDSASRLLQLIQLAHLEKKGEEKGNGIEAI